MGGSDRETLLRPHSVQILSVFRLLGSDTDDANDKINYELEN